MGCDLKMPAHAHARTRSSHEPAAPPRLAGLAGMALPLCRSHHSLGGRDRTVAGGREEARQYITGAVPLHQVAGRPTPGIVSGLALGCRNPSR